MEIRIKPEVVTFRTAYSPYDVIATPERIRAKARGYAFDRTTSRDEGVYVYWMEKHRRRVRYIQEVTRTGKPSKKAPKRVVTPTYWCYRIHFIPKAVVDLLKVSGKKIVQHDRHWSIEKAKP